MILQNPQVKLAFSIVENPGVYALLLGSGLSRSSEIPTGWEITLDLIRRFASSQGVSGHTDWAKWYKSNYKKDANYSDLLTELTTTPLERRSILNAYIEPNETELAEGKKQPTRAHHAIAGLVKQGYVRIIVTTNFDRLLEQALIQVGIQPTVIASVDALSGAEPIAHSNCFIFKIHGDYKDSRISNTFDELDHYPDEYNKLLERIFDEYGLIISGWSAEWDTALKNALLSSPSRRYPVYWTGRSDLKDTAKNIVTSKKATVIPIQSADLFFEELAENITTLRDARQLDTNSVELLVGKAKRYLSKDEYRIKLSQLLSDELSSLFGRLEFDEFVTKNIQPGQVNFQKRIQLYDSICEPITKLMGLLGVWGNPHIHNEAKEVIKTIVEKTSELREGFQMWIYISSYPAVLAFCSYCIGLLRSSKYSFLHDIFHTTVTVENRSSAKFVQYIFLSAWQGSRKEYWRQIEGFDNRKTPFSDHLFEIQKEYSKGYLDSYSNFEYLFSLFEILGAVAYSEDTNLDSIPLPLDYQKAIFLPAGRTTWNSSFRERVISDLGMESKSREILESGFAKGKNEFLNKALANYSIIAGKHQF